MTMQSGAPTPPAAPPAAANSGIEAFVVSPLGKIIVGILTPITRVTVMKSKDAQGKSIEKTPLDNLNGTVVAGLVLTVALVVAVRIWVMIDHAMH